MFCANCGTDCGSDPGKFCGTCGAPLKTTESTQYQSVSGYQSDTTHYPPQPTATQLWNQPIIRIIAVVMATAIVLVMIQQIRIAMYIGTVKLGSPIAYPNQTYGEAFENFFSSPKWKYFQSDDGEDIVEFTGKCNYLGLPTDVKIQFQLYPDKDRFEWIYLGIDGADQNQFMIDVLAETIFTG